MEDAAASNLDASPTPTCPEHGTTPTAPAASPSEAARTPAAKRGASDARAVAVVAQSRRSRRLEEQAAERQDASISSPSLPRNNEDDDVLPRRSSGLRGSELLPSALAARLSSHATEDSETHEVFHDEDGANGANVDALPVLRSRGMERDDLSSVANDVWRRLAMGHRDAGGVTEAELLDHDALRSMGLMRRQ